MSPNTPLKIVIIEDDPVQSMFWKLNIEKRFGSRISVETFSDPREGVKHLNRDVALLMVDWLMPYLDGSEVIREAIQRGVDTKRIIVFSVRPAEEIHKKFSSNDCLAIIEKGDPAQEAVLYRILGEMAAPLQGVASMDS